MSKTAVYASCPTKRARRTKADMAGLKAHILAALEEEWPQTCRQVFYRLVSAGAVAKTEAEYDNTVIRLLTNMRLGACPGIHGAAVGRPTAVALRVV